MSLQTDLRDPLQAWFRDPHAPAIEATMRPTRWVDPGGDANYRFVRRTHPVRLVAYCLVVVGLLFWIWLPVQLAVAVWRASSS